MTPHSDDGLDPGVRARLDRLVAEAGPRRAAGLPRALVPGAETDAPAEPGPQHQSERADEPMRVGVGALVRIGRKHAWAVALLVLVAVVASSAWSMRARAVEVTPIASAVPKSPTAESVPARSATPSPAPTVTVHVMGAVANPGVLTLPAPARVRDAITAAGGLRADADPGELNLAALVADGAQIVIGTTAKPRGEVRTGAGASGQAEGTGAAPGGATLIDLNTATADDLDGLPGVGPVTAQAILAWRAKHGRFTSIDELQEVDGIGPKTFAQIAPHVRV